jgi:hypothetical protein
MPVRCKSIAGQQVTLVPGDRIIPGCELVYGSVFINGDEIGSCSIDGKDIKEECESAGGTWVITYQGGTEVFPPLFFDGDDMKAYAGDNGTTVIWPETGNDVYQYSRGETVPVGTEVHQGEVKDGGVWYDAPHTVENEGAKAGPSDADISLQGSDEDISLQGSDEDDEGDGGPPATTGTPPESEQLPGFCDPTGAFPGDDDMGWLRDLANMQLPDLKMLNLSGFTAFITKQLSKLNAAIAKVNEEVDALISMAKLDPEKICTDPVRDFITFLMKLLEVYMKVMKVLMAILKIIKIIKRIMKLIRKILKWTPPFIVPLVEKLLDLLALIGLVDMIVDLVTQTIGKFAAILPTLYAQLISILAGCVNKPLDDEESCVEVGGTWISPEEIAELKKLGDKMSSEQNAFDRMMSGDKSDVPDDEDGTGFEVGAVDGDTFGFCSIVEHTNKKNCEGAGGVWSEMNVDTDFSQIDTSPLTDELLKQIEELDKCFADPTLQQYLEDL